MKHLVFAAAVGLFCAAQVHAQNTSDSLRSIYGMDQSDDTGNGMSVGIVINGYFDAASVRADLRKYSRDAGLPAPQLTYVYVGSHPVQGQTADWNAEARIDTQMVHLMAPNAAIVVFVDNGAPGQPLAAVRRAANYGVQVVSMSFGQPEANQGNIDAWEAVFSNHPDVTFVAGSGDSGSNGGNVAYPASSPEVLAVGGVVEDGSANPAGWARSGGGQSGYFGIPDYQSNLPIDSGGSRMVPDIAMNSAGQYARIYSSLAGGYVAVVGTSIAAPLAAGMIAAVDEEFGGGIGDVHPYIYSVMDQGLQTNYFRDPVSGNNGGFSCQPGYDMVTGAGVPTINQFINMVAGQ